jgi:uncharacterized membrane protein
MGASKPAVVALCGALAVSFVGSAGAQQPPAPAQNPTFQLAVCNLSDFQGVFFAVKYKQSAESWAVDGWYAIPDGGCTLIGTFQRDSVYYYAESNDGARWNGAATDQTAQSECVDPDKWFKQAAGSSACATGQTAQRFRMITVPANLPRLTFSLTGKR